MELRLDLGASHGAIPLTRGARPPMEVRRHVLPQWLDRLGVFCIHHELGTGTPNLLTLSRYA